MPTPPSPSPSPPPATADVAADWTSLAIIAQLARGRGCWGREGTHWSAPLHRCVERLEGPRAQRSGSADREAQEGNDLPRTRPQRLRKSSAGRSGRRGGRQVVQRNAKGRAETVILQERAKAAWLRRWSSLLACSMVRAFSESLAERQPVPCMGNVPSTHEVIREDRFS